MQFDLKRIDLGYKIMLAGILLAFISLFLPWADVSFGGKQNAFPEGEFLIFLPYLYPIIQIIRGAAVQKIVGFVCALLPLAGGVFWAYIYSSDYHQEPMAGVFLFTLASVAVLAGLTWSFRR